MSPYSQLSALAPAPAPGVGHLPVSLPPLLPPASDPHRVMPRQSPRPLPAEAVHSRAVVEQVSVDLTSVVIGLFEYNS